MTYALVALSMAVPAAVTTDRTSAAAFAANKSANLQDQATRKAHSRNAASTAVSTVRPMTTSGSSPQEVGRTSSHASRTIVEAMTIPMVASRARAAGNRSARNTTRYFKTNHVAVTQAGSLPSAT
jgi:hypothetical protein